MNDPTVVSLTTLARGAAPELFARELDTILENLLDPNTDPEATRQIILTITFTGNPKREMAAVGVECKAKLAPALPATSAIWLGRRDGRAVGVEHNPQQESLFGDQPAEVDKTTGEILPFHREGR